VRDGAIRRLVKGLARPLSALDLLLTRWVHAARGQRARYRLIGSCNGCGRCCESPSEAVNVWTFRLPSLRRLYLWWQRVVNGFELVSRDARFKVFVFKCTHYDPVSKRCDSYESRPLMCRDYPANQTFEAVPALFPECSYVVQDKKAAQLKAALKAAGVEGEKLAEIEKKLFLTETDDE